MPLFKIFAGMGGGFGGATYQGTEEFETEEQAMSAAYNLACDFYESQEGCGCDGYEEFITEATEQLDENDYEDESDYGSALEEYANALSDDARESWIDYWVEETDSMEEEE